MSSGGHKFHCNTWITPVILQYNIILILQYNSVFVLQYSTVLLLQYYAMYYTITMTTKCLKTPVLIFVSVSETKS